MNIKDFKDSLDYLVKAEITPFIWGHAGIGKSSIVKQYADSKGFKFFPFYLGTQSDLGDILGLADFVRDSDGTAVATTFATPEWLRNTIVYCEENPESGAVIFLDEFNRARRDILNGMFSLALDKTFHTLKLPKNCHIIAAGNPPTEEYVTTDVDETALMARFVHIKLEPTFEEWLGFAAETKVDNTLVQFLRQQPELLEDSRSDFKLPIKVDRRAWSRLNKLMALKTPAHILESLMAGIVGLERTVAYLEFLKSQDKPLTASEVLSGNYFELIKKWGNPESISASLLHLTIENLEGLFKELEKGVEITLVKDQNGRETRDIKIEKTLSDKEVLNLWEFFKFLPKDIAFKFIDNIRVRESFLHTIKNNTLFEDFLLEIIKIKRQEAA